MQTKYPFMPIKPFSDEYFMYQALEEAIQAQKEGEIPVGAVVVAKNRIIGKGYNQVERLQDVSAHAEMIAVSAAANYMGAKYLEECKIYITLEPCPMCAHAIASAQIREIFYAVKDPNKGFSLFTPSLLHPKTIVKTGLLAEESRELLRSFFSQKRK